MTLGMILCCLAALLPAVMLYFPNIGEIPLPGMLPYFVILAGLGVLAWAAAYLVFRRKGMAGLTAAVWLLVLLNAGRLAPYVPALGYKGFAAAVLAFLALATFGLSRLKEEIRRDAVKVAALALAAFVLATALPALLRGPQGDGEESAADAGTETAAVQEIDLTPAEGADRPNIYWILSDEYAGSDELNKYYHYDNSAFYDALRGMGFTVSEHSYNWSSDTYVILRDILSLGYTSFGERTKEAFIADPDLPLWSLLKDLGYTVCEAESTNKFRLFNRLKFGVEDTAPRTADGDAVANLLLRGSILYGFEDRILNAVAPQLSAKYGREAVLNVLEWAEDPENLRGGAPCCTIIYFQFPHSPFYFDRNGNSVPEAEQRDGKRYLDQLIYATERIEKICGAILEADPDAIVILQSDHGYRYVPNVTMLDQTNILNAVYFRGEAADEIDGLNGLNTWLKVLNRQFRLELPGVKEKRMRNVYRETQRDPDAEDPNEGQA